MSKRTCQSFQLEKKVEILSEINAGKLSKTAIAKKFGIAKSTLSGILKDTSRILETFNSGEFGPKLKRMRTAAHKDVEDVLVAWIQRARSANLPVNGVVVRAKAEEIASCLNIDFSCSDGWLNRFRRRHGLIFRAIVGEAAAVDESVCEDWRSTRMKKLLEEYEPANVYNVDEIALYYQLLLEKTLTFAGDTCTGSKHSKLRVTVLVGANMTGTDKLKLLVIGKAKSPRCFKNKKTLPVAYASNSKSWMTQALFEQWLREMDRRFVRENRKVMILVDNCPGHGNVSGLFSIRLEFLPPNTTAKLQPMDKGVIRSLKRHYRRSLLQRMLLCMETGKEYQVNLLTSETPAENSVEELPEDDDPNLLSDLKSAGIFMDMVAYVNVDDDVATCRDDTMEALIEETCTEKPSETEAGAIEEQGWNVEPTLVTCDAADAALNVLLQFFEERERTDVFEALVKKASRKIETAFSVPVPGTSMSEGYQSCGKWIANMRTAYNPESKILEALPEATHYMVRKSRKISKEKHMWAAPDPYQGHLLSEEHVNAALHFFTSDDLDCSVQSPRPRDVIQIKEGGVKPEAEMGQYQPM
ncbi:tigger transposable element-derived protein 4-like [Ornithodoros turicata]|uniref:tigger transposable element-derived protein 4-like n=1 Tax=Ornithodoros turicata TaxID=34597 RepID=UPI003139CCB3